jgi:hypothetical protein
MTSKLPSHALLDKVKLLKQQMVATQSPPSHCAAVMHPCLGLASLHSQVDKVASGVQELRNATVSSLASLSERNTSQLSKVAAQGQAFAKEAVAAGEAAASVAQAAVSALAAALRAQTQELEALAAAQAQAVTKAQGAVSSLAGCARSGLQGESLLALALNVPAPSFGSTCNVWIIQQPRPQMSPADL